MKKMNSQERTRQERDETLVKFLEKTKKGEYAEITSTYVSSGRLPDYNVIDYEEDAYIFSYS